MATWPVSTRQEFPGLQILDENLAIKVYKCPARSGQALQHEAFAAEEPGAQPFAEVEVQFHALVGAQEGVLLDD